MTKKLQVVKKLPVHRFYHFRRVSKGVDQTLMAIVEELKRTDNPYYRIEIFEKLRQRWMEISPGTAEYNLMLDCCLLNDPDVRREAAYLLQDEALIFSPVQKWIMAFALKRWETFLKLTLELNLKGEMYRILLEVDYRTRLQAMRNMEITPESPQELCLLNFLKADFSAIIDDLDERNAVYYEVLLRKALKDKNLPYFFRKECSQILEQITEDQTEVEVEEKPKMAVVTPVETKGEIEELMEYLQRKGVWLNGKLEYPELHFSQTGRIVYRNPGVQNIPRDVKPLRLKPPSARFLFLIDFNQIEPRIVLNWMVENMLIELEDIPEDVYSVPGIADRERAKRVINQLINGGSCELEVRGNRFLKQFVVGIWRLRQHLLDLYEDEGAIFTISRRRIEVNPGEKNFAGKLVNRYVQGSAADYFHDRLLAVSGLLKCSNVKLYFLLYDEVWFYADNSPDVTPEEIQQVINEAPEFYSNYVPITSRLKKLYWNERWLIDLKDDGYQQQQEVEVV